MREDEALYQAIVANPDEDTPRLAYADWLDENQPDPQPSPATSPSARAEFIRVQCRLATMTPDHPEYTDLLDQQDILGDWLATFAKEKRTLPRGLQWDDGTPDDYVRGFPGKICREYGSGDSRAVAKLCTALQRAHETITVCALRLYAYTAAQMAEFLRQPAVASLRSLFMQPTGGEEGDFFDLDGSGDFAEWIPRTEEGTAELIAGALAESPHVRNLRDLRLFFPLTDAAVEQLASARYLDNLTDLTIELRNVSPNALRVLTRASWFRNLRSLRLQERLEDPILIALANLPPFPNLRALDLSDNAFSAEGLGRLATSRAFPNLIDLDLGRMRLGADEIAALARAKWRLASLDLRACGIGNAGAVMLANSRLLEGVRISDLAANNIGPKGIKALAASPRVSAIRHLDLGYNTLGKSGLLAIARSRFLRELTRLDLSTHRDDSSGYTVATVAEFLTQLNMPNLRRLTLNELPIGMSGAKAIAGSPALSQLSYLDLRECRIGDKGLAALAASPHLQRLGAVWLFGNRLGKGAAVLADRKIWPLLSRCSLHGNSIPRGIAKRISARPGISADTG